MSSWKHRQRSEGQSRIARQGSASPWRLARINWRSVCSAVEASRPVPGPRRRFRRRAPPGRSASGAAASGSGGGFNGPWRVATRKTSRVESRACGRTDGAWARANSSFSRSANTATWFEGAVNTAVNPRRNWPGRKRTSLGKGTRRNGSVLAARISTEGTSRLAHAMAIRQSATARMAIRRWRTIVPAAVTWHGVMGAQHRTGGWRMTSEG